MISQRDELQDRVHAKQKELEAHLSAARADGRRAARTMLESTQARLRELEGIVSEGWDELSEDAAAKLNEWLSSAKETVAATDSEDA